MQQEIYPHRPTIAFITRIKGILALEGWEVCLYVGFLILLTVCSNIAANSRCFNPITIPFAEQNKILSDYEKGPALNRQLRHINWILKHEGKEEISK